MLSVNTTKWESACNATATEKPKQTGKIGDFWASPPAGTRDNKTEKRTYKRPVAYTTGRVTSSNNAVSISDNSGKRKRTPTKLAQLSDDDEDFLKSYHIPKITNNSSSTKTATVKATSRRNAFGLDDSQDVLLKCVRCEKKFTEESYQEHTNQCLDESTMSSL